MDWKNILTSVLSAAFIVGLLEFFIKQGYKKLLEKKIEEVKEQLRQKGKVYDIQLNAYLVMDELVYRARNAVKEIYYLLNSGETDVNDFAEFIEKLKTYNNALMELLYEKRAVLPPGIFKNVHKLKTEVQILHMQLLDIHRNLLRENVVLPQYKSQVDYHYKKIDELYNELTTFIQENIRVL